MQLEAGCHGVHFLIVVVGLPLLNRNIVIQCATRLGWVIELTEHLWNEPNFTVW